ncbi:Beta-lactamase-like domain-containing protein [Strongyloides ratti]|uniref:Metallo-beta-lactamase domain-containing protein 1 n=1 Tax=Strongyloides ratti TaxID=34506 RepID=A0A090KY75_STRRB|nr:Beta-lactamase-like domain-containing protein [Strongyloides ratti]CEF60158.1 Beta-lactamase-like domain-containing protein [Strongyloides ratti]
MSQTLIKPNMAFFPQVNEKDIRNRRSLSIPSDIKDFKFNTVYYPMPDPRQGPTDGPTVIPIVYGNFNMTDGDMIKLSTTSILILDENSKKSEKCYILVDTGLSLFKNTVTGGLAAHGVKLSDINKLILTHTDVDNLGNLNNFPDALIFSGNREIKRASFKVNTEDGYEHSEYGMPTIKLCDNTEIMLTPGQSPEGLSVIARNVSGYGDIAIVGNLFISESDLTKPLLWQQFVKDANQASIWEASREQILCTVDFIAPGYGVMFKIPDEIKNQVKNKCNEFKNSRI